MKENINDEIEQEEFEEELRKESEEEYREELREELFCCLEGTSKEEPLLFCVVLESNPENCGLSSLEMPRIDKAYLQEGEGIIWFHISNTPDDEWVEFDDMYTEDLQDILNELS